MKGQMTIFDFINDETPFCWDADVNFIESELTKIGDKYGFKNQRSDFTVKAHCPQYGFRLAHEFRVRRAADREQDFVDDLDRIVKEADRRGIELEPMWGALWFCEGEGTLYCYGTFKDARRKRRTA